MAAIETPKLHGVAETLLIPLYFVARESSRPDAIIRDGRAVQAIERIDYDFSAIKLREHDAVFICMRRREFDRHVRDFLARHPDAAVAHIGYSLGYIVRPLVIAEFRMVQLLQQHYDIDERWRYTDLRSLVEPAAAPEVRDPEAAATAIDSARTRDLARLEQQHAIERDRTRIAKDIHDDIGAGLTQITLLSELARRLLSHFPTYAELSPSATWNGTTLWASARSRSFGGSPSSVLLMNVRRSASTWFWVRSTALKR